MHKHVLGRCSQLRPGVSSCAEKSPWERNFKCCNVKLDVVRLFCMDYLDRHTVSRSILRCGLGFLLHGTYSQDAPIEHKDMKAVYFMEPVLPCHALCVPFIT